MLALSPPASAQRSTSPRDRSPKLTSSKSRLSSSSATLAAPPVGQAFVVRLARGLLLATLAYACWRFGAVDTLPLLHIAWSLIATTVLVAIAMVIFGYRVSPPSMALVWPIFLFIAYGLFQSWALPPSVPTVARQAASIKTEFAVQPAALLIEAANRLGEPISDELISVGAGSRNDGLFSNSLIPHASVTALLPLALAASVALLSSTLFTTRRSRTVFLWCLLIHCAAMATWGIIQRSTGSLDLLPGFTSPYRALPFGTFIYRNAGAAAVLPGIAAAIALLYSNRSSQGESPVNSAYGSKLHWLKATDLTLITLASIVIIGIVVALSRGAWIAALVSLVMVAILFGGRFRWYQLVAVLTLMAGTATIGVYQVTEMVSNRVDRFNIDDLTLDERWAHWKDGLATAIDHFPFGCGLGSYGYAALLHQSKPRNGWFREAHNQYLEIATEMGVVGIVAMLGMVVFAGRAYWQLRRRPIERSGERERQSWGLFAVAVVLFAMVQNFGDFVIEIPANTLLYACFLGIIARVAAEAVKATQKRKKPGSIETFDVPKSWGVGHAATLSLIAAALMFVAHHSRLEHQGDRVIEQTSLDELDDRPTDVAIAQRLAQLDEAITAQPRRSELYRQRSMWHLARYRAALIDTADAAGESVPWISTAPEIMFQSLASMPPAAARVTIEAMTTPELNAPLVASIHDIAAAVSANPLQIQAHFLGGQIACFTGIDPRPWVDRIARISSPDAYHLYACGLLAWSCDADDVAIRQWHDCLSINTRFASDVLPLASQRLSAVEIAERIVPKSQPGVMIELIRTVLTANPEPSPSVRSETLEFASKIAEDLIEESTVELEQRHAISATLLELAGAKGAATRHWLAAVDAAPAIPAYRLKAAEALRRDGDFEEALRHAILGGTLSRGDGRFENLAKRIRTDILKSKPTPSYDLD